MKKKNKIIVAVTSLVAIFGVDVGCHTVLSKEPAPKPNKTYYQLPKKSYNKGEKFTVTKTPIFKNGVPQNLAAINSFNYVKSGNIYIRYTLTHPKSGADKDSDDPDTQALNHKEVEGKFTTKPLQYTLYNVGKQKKTIKVTPDGTFEKDGSQWIKQALSDFNITSLTLPFYWASQYKTTFTHVIDPETKQTNYFWVYTVNPKVGYKAMTNRLQNTVIENSPYRYQLAPYYKDVKWHNGGINEMVDMKHKKIQKLVLNYNLVSQKDQFIDQRIVQLTNIKTK